MNYYMRDLILLISFILPFLLSCKQGGQEVADFDDEMPKFPDQRFDSLMWLQYHCPDDEEKTAYEWNWAYDVRETLGVDDLDSLAVLTREQDDGYQSYASSCVTSDMVTASEVYAGTARFRMLNAYEALAELTAETPLGSLDDCYYRDYVLWEELYKEYDEYYNETGGFRFVNLNSYYAYLADLRTELLRQELACFSAGKNSPKLSDAKADLRWDKQHKAIRRWYDYRLTMAEKLQQTAPSQAQCIRALSRQAVQWYMDFTTDYETSTQVPED